jgi:MipA family protein
MKLFFLAMILSLNTYAKNCNPESPSLLNFACENNKSWQLGLGFELEHGSAADASKKVETEFEPGGLIHASNNWAQFFFEGQESGLRFFPSESFNFALVARLEPGREVEDDPTLLAGQGNSDDKWMFRPELRLSLVDNWNLWLGATALLGDSEIGNLYIAVLGLGMNKIGMLDLEILIQQRWGSSAFINKDFGVDATQSSNNGLPQYYAESGTQSTAISLIGKIDWSNRLKTLFEIAYDKYADRLKESPIIKKGQNYEYEAGFTFLYLF